MFCYSDNVVNKLKYNRYIFISLTDSHATHPKEQCSSKETGIQSLEILWRQYWWRHCIVSSVQVRPWVSESKLLPFWLKIWLPQRQLESIKMHHKSIVIFLYFPWIHFFYLRHFDLVTEDFMSGRLENNRLWGLLLKDLKQPAGKQLSGKNPKLGNFEK